MHHGGQLCIGLNCALEGIPHTRMATFLVTNAQTLVSQSAQTSVCQSFFRPCQGSVQRPLRTSVRCQTWAIYQVNLTADFRGAYLFFSEKTWSMGIKVKGSRIKAAVTQRASVSQDSFDYTLALLAWALLEWGLARLAPLPKGRPGSFWATPKMDHLRNHQLHLKTERRPKRGAS